MSSALKAAGIVLAVLVAIDLVESFVAGPAGDVLHLFPHEVAPLLLAVFALLVC